MQTEESCHPAQWWKKLEDGRVLCYLCPRECKLADDARGFCFVRKNVGGKLVLATYGRSSGFCIDPIEKKPLNHFLPGTSILSFGTAGCNLGCRFCQNHDISKARQMDRLMDSASPEVIAETATRMGCRSVAYTYNDPVIFAEYAIDVARECHDRDVQNVVVSAGYISPQARPAFFRHVDAANIDLKAFTNHFYTRHCLAALEPVLDTLVYIHKETRIWLEVTTLLIPGLNDSEEEIDALTDWYMAHLGADVPLHFTAFHPDYKMMDRSRTSHETILRARDQAIGKGVNYVYAGNVHDDLSGSTYCPACGRMVIERDWYEVGEWHLDGGRCGFCGAAIPGVFERAPGRWGSKRMPVRIAHHWDRL